MAKKKKSAKKSDTLRPSWATHELCALALTLILALWVVVKYAKKTQPPKTQKQNKNPKNKQH